MTTAARAWVPALTFASRLALIRNQMRWNAKEAALACGLPPSSWRNWEISGRQPHNYLEVCGRISERTGVSYDWLTLGRTPEGVDVHHQSPEPGLGDETIWTAAKLPSPPEDYRRLLDGYGADSDPALLVA